MDQIVSDQGTRNCDILRESILRGNKNIASLIRSADPDAIARDDILVRALVMENALPPLMWRNDSMHRSSIAFCPSLHQRTWYACWFPRGFGCPLRLTIPRCGLVSSKASPTPS